MSLIFRNLTQAFVDFQAAIAFNSPDIDTQAAHFRKTASQDAVWLVVIGGGMFVCTYIYMFAWVRTGEHLAKRIRENYLRAVLRQDIAFFDKVGAGEVATRIQTDTRAPALLCNCCLTYINHSNQISSNKVLRKKSLSVSTSSPHSWLVSSLPTSRTGVSLLPLRPCYHASVLPVLS
jgi:hypothetical protein